MFNPIMIAALRMSAVSPYRRIKEEIFYEHIKTMNLRFYSYFLPRPFQICQMYVTFKAAKKCKKKKCKIH